MYVVNPIVTNKDLIIYPLVLDDGGLVELLIL